MVFYSVKLILGHIQELDEIKMEKTCLQKQLNKNEKTLKENFEKVC